MNREEAWQLCTILMLREQIRDAGYSIKILGVT